MITFSRSGRSHLGLFELGDRSIESMIGIAGMSRVEFMMTLGRYKVFPLEAELQDLEGQSLASL